MGLVHFIKASKFNSDDAAFKAFSQFVENKENKEREDYSYGLNMVGYYHLHGRGTQRDYIKAREYFLKGEALGNSMSANNLGNMYRSGWGVTSDQKKALQFYRKSAELLHDIAINTMAVLHEEGNEVELDYAKASEWFIKAAKCGYPYAITQLSMIYKEGRFRQGKMQVEADQEKAAYFSLMAIQCGEDQKLLLGEILRTKKVAWAKMYHVHWPLPKERRDITLNDQIKTILLVMKNRKQSKYNLVPVLVKGIVMDIIKYLCHFRI